MNNKRLQASFKQVKQMKTEQSNLKRENSQIKDKINHLIKENQQLSNKKIIS